MASGDDLIAIEGWIGGLIGQLKPAARKKLAVLIGRQLRKQNAARIRENVEPDGTPMEPRKPRKRRASARTGRTERKGKMFRKLGQLKSQRIRATPDDVEISFAKNERLAAQHHFGLDGFVGRDPSGRAIRYRYPARRLLGFGPDDKEAIMDLVLNHLTEG